MSKRLIVVSLLMILISACSSQVTVFTPSPEAQSTQPVESIATATATPLIVAATETPLLPVPTFPFYCRDIPAPHVQIGQQVTVMVENSDKLKLREIPEVSEETAVMDLDQFTELKILEGAVCVHSDETGADYWFWKVSVLPRGEIGWVAEGDSQRYFIEPSTDATVVNTVTEATAVVCTDAVTRVAIGQQVTVITDDTDKLKLREAPVFSPDSVVMELNKFTKLNILEGPVCAYSDETSIYYWLWKVEVLPSGEIGWIAEGDFFRYFIE